MKESQPNKTTIIEVVKKVGTKIGIITDQAQLDADRHAYHKARLHRMAFARQKHMLENHASHEISEIDYTFRKHTDDFPNVTFTECDHKHEEVFGSHYFPEILDQLPEQHFPKS